MLELYTKFHIARDYEQRDLFEQLADDHGVRSVLYPGSFVHITPSLFIPVGCYVDSDRQAARFFRDTEPLIHFVRENARYSEMPVIRFYHQDYHLPLPEPDHSFDLLISQYAGLISEPCKRYLRPHGLLLANNSHGDAGIASLDPEYSLCGVYHRRGGRYVYSTDRIERYFVAKNNVDNLYGQIRTTNKGVAYTHTAHLYLFRYEPR